MTPVCSGVGSVGDKLQAELRGAFGQGRHVSMLPQTCLKCTPISPASEAVSLIWPFHCLWQLGKREEALEEIKRFQSVSNSEGYREIVKPQKVCQCLQLPMTVKALDTVIRELFHCDCQLHVKFVSFWRGKRAPEKTQKTC
jgi:hypothetical protein